MATLDEQLALNRCPHCNVDTPSLVSIYKVETNDVRRLRQRVWRIYKCSRCGGLVIASSIQYGGAVHEVYPKPRSVDTDIPPKARAFLEQALHSLQAPAGAVMLAASAVDAMLKDKGYKDGNLKLRIEQAAKDHIITKEMAEWAHKVRLDANDQRHADESAHLPTLEEAQMSVEFALALGEFMFVLPERVRRGLDQSVK